MPYQKILLTLENTDSTKRLGDYNPPAHATAANFFRKGGRPGRDKDSPLRKDNLSRAASDIAEITVNVPLTTNHTTVDFFKKKKKKK